jgi:tetratricopeptide (TPR) repeat protein
MKNINLAACAIILASAAFSAAQIVAAAIPSTDRSPAEQALTEARKAIREKPEQYAGYNLLATALMSRAEETSDPDFYQQAEGALERSLEIAPNNFDTAKIWAAILLAEKEYPAALATARALNGRVPDDVTVYGLLTDANIGLGNYKDAENAAQWMLNLRPGNLPALIRASHLRELFGDTEGAYELMELAYQSTPPTELMERAGALTQMGHLRMASVKIDAAERFFQQALVVFPDYPAALENLARVRIAQKRYAEAIPLLERRYRSVPRAGNLYDLAEALHLAGEESDAKQAFANFEAKSLLESDRKDNSNIKLAFYYADHALQPAKALKVAQQEYAWHRDVYMLDAYAWALHVNGQEAESYRQIVSALAVGIVDAGIFRHAGEIALKTGDIAEAKHYLEQSASLMTADSEQARDLLITLSGPLGQ